MLPGLVLTVGLVAQSLAGLVSMAPRNADAPRFVNIGNDIIESKTAKPVAPIGECTPAPPAPTVVVEPQYILVPEQVEDVPEASPSDDQSAVAPIDGVPFFPVVVGAFPRHPHRAPPSAARPQIARMSSQGVLLPNFRTVLLPPGFTPPRPAPSVRPGPSTPLKAGR